MGVSGCVDEQTEYACHTAGGFWEGPDTQCGSPGICTGACCLWDSGGCVEATEGVCAAFPNTDWRGLGTDCSDGDEDGVVDCLDRCPETEPGVIVDDAGCPDPRYLDGNNGAEKPVLPDDADHPPSRQPLTGQFSGSTGCGALGLIHLTFLLTGLYCLRAGRNRPRA